VGLGFDFNGLKQSLPKSPGHARSKSTTIPATSKP
jgi:hypothetical protein